MDIQARERFWSKVDRGGGPDACWLWTAHKTRGGYGQLRVDGHQATAHRVSWELAHGPIPPGHGYHGTCVLHRCDNPPCCNPSHLFLGTNADNMADMKAKGRQARGDTHGARTHLSNWRRGDAHWARAHPERLPRGSAHGARLRPETRPRGEQHGRAVLSRDDVLAIRGAVAAGESQASLVAKFHVNKSTVSRIVLRKIWRHLP